MKFWRIFAAAAVVGMLLPGSVVFADDDDDDDDSEGCAKETNKALVEGLTLCPAMASAFSQNGNGFPWENSTGFFATFRNQYLYPSSIFDEASKTACTVESIQARQISFASTASVNNYTSFSNGQPSTFVIGGAVAGNLSATFALNPSGYEHCRLSGTNATPIVIDNTTGIRGSTLSNCTSCLDEDRWCQIGDISAGLDPAFGPAVLWDGQQSVGTGNSGNSFWSFNQTCAGGTPQRAFGSGAFANPNHLTTALGVDSFDVMWVFEGLAPPPAATVEQQIKEIIRLLLTPEGLRCSALDLTPGNGKIEDNPITWPNGANWDPMSQQVSSGKPQTGDELADDLRNTGWKP
jgi:hypothetical protein